jgi:hypothetical protein
MRGVSEKDDWTGWCDFFLTAIEQQAIRNLKISQNIQDLYEEMKSEFSSALASKWSVNAVDFVFTYPVFYNNRFSKRGGIPSSSASRFSKILLERGWLRVVNEASGRRPALYSFEPLVQLLRV